MATSRDDFVIAIRSAFLKKGTQQRFSLISLLFISIIFFTLGILNFKSINYLKAFINEIVYRSSFIVSAPENYIVNNYSIIIDHIDLYSEYKKIKIELEELKKKDLLNDFIVLENKRLKNVLDEYLESPDEIIAKVLVDKQSPFLKSIIVNKGSKHGLKLGSAVLDKGYLVGKIVEINYLTSRVILLSDLNSKIPVFLEPLGIQAIISGSGKSYGILEYTKEKLLSKNQDISIYTSGYGDLFKAGIPVGKLYYDKILKKNKVEFFSDFTQLNYVKISSLKKLSL